MIRRMTGWMTWRVSTIGCWICKREKEEEEQEEAASKPCQAAKSRGQPSLIVTPSLL
jgi:hypothetical protein